MLMLYRGVPKLHFVIHGKGTALKCMIYGYRRTRITDPLFFSMNHEVFLKFLEYYLYSKF